ncbi:MAG TPA: nickel-dependent lactate racemase [Symbiobacteriaceae bacterium]|nr:nickel-dependent lactate racemase [Symbiobacteriaceae bacterium]
MQHVTMPFGKGELAFELPAANKTTTVVPNHRDRLSDPDAAVRHALRSPIQSPPLREIVQPGESVCIITSDITRLSTRPDIILPMLLQELNDCGIPDEQIFIMMACGDHRSQTPEEHRKLVGDRVYGRVRIYDHNAKDEANLVYLGATRRGTPVWLNKLVHAADRIIITGGLSHHSFAGYGGGRKALLPGVAGYQTIQANHSLVVRKAPGEVTGPGAIVGNPLAADLMEAAYMAGPDFLINNVTNEHNEVVAVVAGEMEAAWLEGVRICDSMFTIALEQPADLVIASCGGYPKDMQLYQSMKGLENAAKAVRDGGTIILISECSDGPGHPEFVEAFKLGGLAAVGASLQERYTIQKYVCYFVTEILERAAVILVSSLPDDVVKAVGMIPAHSPAEALALAGARAPHAAETILIPYSMVTFPVPPRR